VNLYGGARNHLSLVERGRRWFRVNAVGWLALLLLCAAYIQGGIYKATHFSEAIAEMQHFGLSPPPVMAVLVIAVELGASALILTGRYRWFGASALAGFTFLATLMAYRFWEIAPPDRIMVMNGFFEHLGLIGGLLLVAWHDLRTSGASAP
jgi:uncharacterized membrane protein YphA (DoxX/SURF4 family)